jgi:hypothetical protein
VVGLEQRSLGTVRTVRLDLRCELRGTLPLTNILSYDFFVICGFWMGLILYRSLATSTEY